MVFAELAILNFLKLYFHNSKRKPLKPEDFRGFGAASQIRTGDLILTKDALYRLSYSSIFVFPVSQTALTLYYGLRHLSSIFSIFLEKACRRF